MEKKKYPLKVHQNLNTLKKDFTNYFAFASDVPLMRFEDKDETSTFFFQVNSFKTHHSEFYYEVTYQPLAANNLATNTDLIKYPDVEKLIQSWVEVIKKFDETPHFSNDPIIEQYADEYFDEYKLIEEDADYRPFDIKRQILIDSYLEKTIDFLTQYSESNSIDLEEPKTIAQDLKNQLTELTKNEVVKKLSLLWAVSRKKGLPIIKRIFFEFAKEVIFSLGKKMLGLE